MKKKAKKTFSAARLRTAMRAEKRKMKGRKMTSAAKRRAMKAAWK